MQVLSKEEVNEVSGAMTFLGAVAEGAGAGGAVGAFGGLGGAAAGLLIGGIAGAIMYEMP